MIYNYYYCEYVMGVLHKKRCNICEDPLIQRRPNTECAVRDNSYDKQYDERFPERVTEYACDDKRNYDCRGDIHHGDIEDPVSVSTFSRTTKYVFIAA